VVEVAGARGQLGAMGSGFWTACAVGAVAAGLSGYFALALVLRTVGSRVFHRFAWYCLPLGVLVVALAAWGVL
jgi:undecaprenyl pyrophosphate phosphatase UppP